jgi:regulatory protein
MLRALLDELQAKKQLSDERYAEVRAHWLARKYGAAHVRNDLRAKGVADSLIERGCAPHDELARAVQILRRKYRSAAATREERARRARFLQGRGFSYETIAKALGEVDSEY